MITGMFLLVVIILSNLIIIFQTRFFFSLLSIYVPSVILR